MLSLTNEERRLQWEPLLLRYDETVAALGEAIKEFDRYQASFEELELTNQALQSFSESTSSLCVDLEIIRRKFRGHAETFEALREIHKDMVCDGGADNG